MIFVENMVFVVFGKRVGVIINVYIVRKYEGFEDG